MREVTDRGGRGEPTRNQAVRSQGGGTPTSPVAIGVGATLLLGVAYLLTVPFDYLLAQAAGDGGTGLVAFLDVLVARTRAGLGSIVVLALAGAYLGIRETDARGIVLAGAAAVVCHLCLGGLLFGAETAIGPPEERLELWDLLYDVVASFLFLVGAGMVTYLVRPQVRSLELPDVRRLNPSPVVVGGASVVGILVLSGLLSAGGSVVRVELLPETGPAVQNEPLQFGWIAHEWLAHEAYPPLYGILVGVLAGFALTGRDRVTAALAGGVGYGAVVFAVVQGARELTADGLDYHAADLLTATLYPLWTGLSVVVTAVVVAFGIGRFLAVEGRARPAREDSRPAPGWSSRRQLLFGIGIVGVWWAFGAVAVVYDRKGMVGSLVEGLTGDPWLLGSILVDAFSTAYSMLVWRWGGILVGLAVGVVVASSERSPMRAAAKAGAVAGTAYLSVLVVSFGLDLGTYLTTPDPTWTPADSGYHLLRYEAVPLLGIALFALAIGGILGYALQQRRLRPRGP